MVAKKKKYSDIINSMLNKGKKHHHLSKNEEKITLESTKVNVVLQNAFQVCYPLQKRITNLSQKQFFGGLFLVCSSKVYSVWRNNNTIFRSFYHIVDMATVTWFFFNSFFTFMKGMLWSKLKMEPPPFRSFAEQCILNKLISISKSGTF